MNLDQLIADLPNTASPIEWLCTFVGVVCLAACIVGAAQAGGDWRFVRRAGPRWPLRLIIAWSHLRRECVNIAVEGGLLTFELAALITPPPVRPALIATALIGQVIFTLIQVLMAYNSLADRYDRARIMRAVQGTIKRGSDHAL